ncbi:integrase core domain-containing protein [Nocardia tenerifensis]|uniref:integrase core domain-containing protein n=1 Tax=Nocardia tenerifensis TaxID=228006 RepID=UPI0009FF3004
MEETGTTHKRPRPYTLRTNGKAERFNGTLAQKWAYVREYDSEQARRAALVDFLNTYNHDRPHAGIGHRSPSSRVPQRNYRLTGPCPASPTTRDLPVIGPEQLILGSKPVQPISRDSTPSPREISGRGA